MTRGAVANGGSSRVHRLGQGRDDLEVERLADGARLLGPVEDRDGPDRGRQGGDDLLGGERLEEPDPEHPDLLAGRDERVDGLLDGAAGRAHHDDHALGVGSAVVVDQPVAAAGPRGELVHDLLDDAGHGQVERVRRLARLEEDVGVLGRAAHDRGVRASGRAAGTPGHRRRGRAPGCRPRRGRAILSISCDVRKPSKKWRNGTRARSVAACATSAKSCASWTEPAASIAQPVVRACITSLWSPKIDRACVAIGPGGDVDDRRRQLAGDLEHVGDHQEQALRRGERRRQGALLERAVQGAGRARLRLHLDDVGDLAPQVRPAGRGPVVAVLGHRRGRA